MNISETMASIRWLFEKHMKNLETAPCKPSERKEQKPHAVVTAETAIKALRLFKEGNPLTEIGRYFNLSPMTVGNIVNRRRAFKSMPLTETEIKKWFGQKKQKHEPTAFNRS